MKEAEGSEVEQVQGAKRRGRGGKWRILLVAALVAAAIAAAVYFGQQRVDEQKRLYEQLRAMAAADPPHAGPPRDISIKGGSYQGGSYFEKPLGPGWYLKLARKCKLPILRRPYLFSSQSVTDEDMAVLGRAKKLRMVGLGYSKISDAGMAHLEGLTKLMALGLNNTQIGDAGLAHLSGLTALEHLSLNETQVTDAGLVHLKKLKNLQSLELNGTEVTNAGLAHLKSLKGLTVLDLFKTGVTSKGVADLKSAIPDLHVNFNQ